MCDRTPLLHVSGLRLPFIVGVLLGLTRVPAVHAGNSKDEVANSPFVEQLLRKGYEVIFFTDVLDEYVMGHLQDYDDKKFANASKEDLKLADKDEVEKKKDKVGMGRGVGMADAGEEASFQVACMCGILCASMGAGTGDACGLDTGHGVLACVAVSGPAGLESPRAREGVLRAVPYAVCRTGAEGVVQGPDQVVEEGA